MGYFLLFIILGLTALALWKHGVEASRRVIRVEKAEGYQYRLICNDGTVYRGSCTVWHYEESGRRVGTFGEDRLSEIWQKYCKWEHEIPEEGVRV